MHFLMNGFAVSYDPVSYARGPHGTCAPRRKGGKASLCCSTGTLSPVRFDGGSCGIAAISSDFQENAAEFLCNPDCVAEGARSAELLGREWFARDCSVAAQSEIEKFSARYAPDHEI